MRKQLASARTLALVLAAFISVYPLGPAALAEEVLQPTDTAHVEEPVLQGTIEAVDHHITGTGTVIDVSELTNVANIHIAEGASAIFDFSNATSLNISGSLNNSGSIFAVTTNTNTQNVTFAANTISNQTTGTISTILPQALQLANYITNLSLTLQANIVENLGAITSAGSLNIIGATSATNGSMQSVAQLPVMQAVNAVNVTTPNFSNFGLVESITSNINIASQNLASITSQVAANLDINNLGGTLQALQGQINFGDSRFNGQQNLSIFGGDVIAQNVNLSAGTGTANMSVNELIGSLNVSGLEAHISASTDNLVIGEACLTGDPTFYNASGNITISNDLIFNEALAIVAKGNISTSGNGIDIATNGGDLLIAAGVNFTPSAGSVTNTLGLGDSLTTISITGGSNGGSINLSGLSSFSSAGTAANEAGGDITLVAYSGSVNGSGKIQLNPDVTLYSGGNGNGANGNVTIISGAVGGNQESLSIGSINATGGSGGSGNIQIATAQPSIQTGNNCANCIQITNGVITNGGSFVIDVNNLKTGASLETKALLASGNITINGGSGVSIAGDMESGKNISITAHNGFIDIFDATQVTAINNISLTALGDVRLNVTNNNAVDSVKVTAGVLSPTADTSQPLASTDILSPGSITIQSQTGNILFGRGIAATSNGGDILLRANEMVDIQAGNALTANGGYIAVSAGESIQIHRPLGADDGFTKFYSVAVYDQGSSGSYRGGGIGIYAEAPTLDVVSALQGIQAQQPGIGEGTIDAHLIQDPTFQRLNGGYIGIHEHGVDGVEIKGSDLYDPDYLAIGGVISIEGGPGDAPSNKIQIEGANMIAIAPTGGTTTTTTTTGEPTTTTTTTGEPTTTTTTGEPTTTTTTGEPTTTTTTGEPTTTTTTGEPTTTTTTGEPTTTTTTGEPTTTTTTGEPTTTTTTGEPTTTTTTGEPTTTTTTGTIVPPGTTGTTTTGGFVPPSTTGNAENTPAQDRFNTPAFFSQLPPTDLTRLAQVPIQNNPGCSPTFIANRPKNENGQFWMLAADPGQPYALANDDEAVILAHPGTRFIASGDHGVNLHSGTLLVAAGEYPITVHTRNGDIQIPAFSAGSIEQSRFGEVRVATLEGAAAKWTVEKNGEQSTMTVAYGKEVSAIDSQVAAVGTSDYIAQGTAKTGQLPGLAVAERSAAEPLAAERLSKMLKCKIGCMNKDMKKRFSSLAKSALNISPKISPNALPNTSYVPGASESTNHYLPVAAVSPAAPTVIPSATLRTMPLSGGFAKCSADAVAFDTPEGNIELTHGSILVVAKKPMRVISGNKAVELNAGAIVRLTAAKRTLTVLTLHDDSAGDVIVKTASGKLKSRPGLELVVADTDDSLQAQIHGAKIARRRITTAEIGSTHFSTAEFSIAGLLMDDETLRSMVRSRLPEDRKATNDILKMAAILSHVTRSKGAYLPLPTNR